VHNIIVTVFEKDKDNLSKCKESFKNILPLDLKKEKIAISVESVEGFQQKTIYIIQLKTTKKRHNDQLLHTLFSKLGETDRKRIKKQYLSRLNQEGYFFIRLKKKKFLENKFVLTDSGDCFHIKIKLAGFPANWENFVIAAKSVLNNYN
jgi:RNA binding exosome subunit